MSTSVRIWNSPPKESPQLLQTQAHVPIDPLFRIPLEGLVRQVFLCSSANHKQVLFVAPDPEAEVVHFCEQAATLLAGTSGANVAVVADVGQPNPAISSQKKPAQADDMCFWRTHSFVLAERTWKLPAWFFAEESRRETSRMPTATTEVRSLFNFFLFATSAGKPELPLFASICDAAVLVISANRTRRESARSLKEQILRYKLPLLGAVLTDRVHAIPESIHRRL